MRYSPHRRPRLIFILAAIAAPTVAGVLLALLALNADDPWRGVALPALAGVVTGSVGWRVAASLTERGGQRKQLPFAPIAAAALLGTFADHLPVWSRAFLDGCVLGFFLSLLLFLAHRALWTQRAAPISPSRVE
jgi:hypothetical protein